MYELKVEYSAAHPDDPRPMDKWHVTGPHGKTLCGLGLKMDAATRPLPAKPGEPLLPQNSEAVLVVEGVPVCDACRTGYNDVR
ncbi:hypothetical protein [Streptacidiphilus sp. P02-A3a]|uniref:hypothetical protein n=1 Tax=Streptacidiphilus sp. P02-A3a TaxID=2704468 RepID=UPI0015F8CE30|nr:hypothetical protein [Streptacidiphilus sp. P02-A3a]QMU71755.1 hypothetical protein GXP74_29415 [Streptacidiphilus sp. P02-A3a]